LAARIAAVLILASTGLLAAVTAVDTVTLACGVEELQAKALAGTTITQATIVDASGVTPRHCQVDAAVATPGNSVAVRLGLPATWNGKFYFEGVGIFGGAFGSLKAGLDRGYASASTDTGHRASPVDASWAAGSPSRVVDYAYRGTHVSAVAAKAITQAYYGAAPSHAYFNGCSNGGRQALMEAQRFPEDFDGLIAGDPALGTLGQIRRTLTYQQMLSSPDRFVPAAKVALLARKTLEACDARDGLEDGLISDPRMCQFAPETLACTAGDTADCLTKREIETVEAVYADQKTPAGDVMPGFPVGHEDGTTGWQQWITSATPPVARADGTAEFTGGPLGFRIQDGFLKYLASPDGQPIDWRTFSFDRDRARVEATMQMFSPTDPNLAGLRRRGGKLLLYHGWADPAISAYGTLRYYDAAVKQTGGEAKSADFLRLFMAPGMHHCQGNGPGPNTFDMLTALEKWVEHREAPTRIIASHASGGVVDRTRPLCAYPMVARYTGSGSIEAAENFRCQQPEGSK
jgi:feruloyl esterase